jgi:6-phosphogluconate dehydrogenase (decarboxylating)
MLPKGPHVLDAFTNDSNGLLTIHESSSQKLFIECSTIDVKTSLLVAEKVKESGLGQFVDSPVSGGPNGANAGTLTFMVGGTPELFERTKAVVRTMGKEESRPRHKTDQQLSVLGVHSRRFRSDEYGYSIRVRPQRVGGRNKRLVWEVL